jgi:uncharacterized protein (DUF58 family)
MIQTLIPPPVRSQAHANGRWGRVLGYALSARTLFLLAAGCLLAIPGFFHPGFHRFGWAWAMLAWDALVLLLAVLDAAMLPAPSSITIERRFENSPVLGESTQITLEVTQSSNQILEVRITDALHPNVDPMPAASRIAAYPRDPARVTLNCTPNMRGDIALGKIFLRYRGALQLVERWACADLEQNIRVYPPMERSPEDTALYLLRIRQIALQKRRLRLRGLGREFESLREYQRGDELRNIAWPATARRGKIITREFTTERSQQVWMVLDAGRLSRTAFELRRRTGPVATQSGSATAQETLPAEDLLLTVTQFDQASGAAVALAQTVMQAGDKAALLVYGRRIQQQLLPAAGPAHLRQFVDSLSQVRAEGSEANHLSAAARLKHLQRRRGLILWITELADSARRPEVVDAAVDLARRHLVLLVVLVHPQLDQLSRREPANVEEMFISTAATEILDRRREIIARLRRQGVLVVETTPASVKADAINQYLEVKARGML